MVSTGLESLEKVGNFQQYSQKGRKKTKNELRKLFPLILIQHSLESYSTNKNCALHGVSAANMCVFYIYMYRFTDEKRKKSLEKVGEFFM